MTQQLAERGPSALTVDALEESSGRSRGSLYHHFGSQLGVLEAVAGHWREVHCDAVIAEVRGCTEEPGARLHDLAVGLDSRLERGIRLLSVGHAVVMKEVEAVDRDRIAFLTELYTQADVDDPRSLAELEYAAFVGVQYLEHAISRRRLDGLKRVFARLSGV